MKHIVVCDCNDHDSGNTIWGLERETRLLNLQEKIIRYSRIATLLDDMADKSGFIRLLSKYML